jgi:beta-glucosidase
VEGLGANDFSARYTTDYKSAETKTLALEMQADNGYRLMVNGKVLLDEWLGKKNETKKVDLKVKKDSVYHIVVDYWQGDREASIRLSFGNYIETDFDQLVQRHQDADAFVFVGGIAPQLEGEQMAVNEPGFKGGDKTSIMLPAVQTQLMQKLQATGKPVVFVMMTGSAIATPWEADHIPAILNSWYGGQAAGTAAADILFGDYNPSGRLPVTFYRSDDDLADFRDYSMENRTYRYFKGKPLYGFGYGLSYTSFNYALQTAPAKLAKGKDLVLTVKVTNTGKTMGDEVAQLYLINQDKNIKTSLKALKGFQRLSLAPGESKQIKFALPAAELNYIDANGKKTLLKGNVQFSIGGSQPNEPNKTSGNLVKTTVNLL